MTRPEPAIHPASTPGLEDVVAADTVLSMVDGVAGRLVIRGHDLAALAGWRFEDLLALLWRDFLPGDPGADEIGQRLGAARLHIFETLSPALLAGTDGLSPVEALRLMLASLPDSHAGDHAVTAVAAAGVYAAAIHRLRKGEDVPAPDPAASHAADILAMIHGGPVEQEKADALDAYLVTVADHGLNASTFTARVIASTRAGLFSSVTGALCALKGPLHGGAPGPVLDMLDAIGRHGKISDWIAAELERGERLMGFGHRIYRVRDPRADALKRALGKLGDPTGRLAFAEEVEREALRQLAQRRPDRRLETNVEFFTALILEAVGFDRDSFTNVFAAGRMAGWTAHVREQERANRLIRPKSRYTGPMPESAGN
ncbi:citrate synthase/methylcitrate synthase [Pseudohoeflea suaedae]|uniref:Citrate synthase n=1 Tax=Pseudohoeflea suaedae TaxID=877384 RepID=A0A4R5PKD4_9HYPH|nr:citrate synthase/methylcitrate synthase [Pseudohoeflea suaedae]TDH36065.1 citrate synthase/methylcitrate synthase [Pseudohoeflea suaedae]